MKFPGVAALALLLTLTGCASMQRADAHFQGTALAIAQAPDFTLTSDSGRLWTLSSRHGKNVALFFGYTHCPDTCPATLAKLAKAVDLQGGKASNVEIAFVTVDPQRDTPSVMKKYIAHFEGANIVGLTGTPAQVAGVEHEYHVWAQRIPGNHTGKDDYDDAHSSVVYLIDRDGNERVLHGDDDSLNSFTADLHTLVQ